MDEMEMAAAPASAPPVKPTFGEAFRFWLKLGFISFGGPTGQIAIMHAELVERKRWISEGRFLHALNFCMLLPGPEAQQLAIYIGWLLHRTWGGIVAGALFVLPSVGILWALSFVYMRFGNVPMIAAVFYGLQPAVMAIVAAAVLRIGSKALKNRIMWALAAVAFVAIFFLKVPFVLIIAGAGMVGLFGGRFYPDKFVVLKGHGKNGPEPSAVLADGDDLHIRPTWGRAFRVAGLCLLLWWAPIILAGLWQGWHATLFQEGVFFSKAALVTFGGAYAVLPFVAQQAVEAYGWLSPTQMMAGLGLAETTPGPLIMVLQFVGFVGGWQHPGGLTPLTAATLGAAITTWATFVPCFLFIFLGAPHIEQLRNVKVLAAALSTITAAVVGVVLNLAVWFGWHALMPAKGKLDWYTLILSVLFFVAIHRLKWGVVPVVLTACGMGVIYRHFIG
jgi:chromate transporter